MQLDGSSERAAAAARRSARRAPSRSCRRSRRSRAAPPRCTTVREKLGRRRGFGVWANLYTLRSQRNFGAGDLSDLARLAQLAAREGADFVGISPLHALWNRGADVSPYAPVSRLLPQRALPRRAGAFPSSRAARRPAGCSRVPAFQRELARLRDCAARRVRAGRRRQARDPAGAARAASAAAPERGPRPRLRGLPRARGRGARGLRDLRRARRARAAALDWRRWPRELRDPRSPAVARFRREHAREVDFHRFVQFELDRQLGAAAAAARRAGMAIGLYPDLALGSARGGAETWSFPDLFADGASLGAPPDDFSPEGQDWAIPPLDPLAAARAGLRVLPAAAAGGLRARGRAAHRPRAGPVPALLDPARTTRLGGRLRAPARARAARDPRAREPRQGALVIGEDLGTVPLGTQARLARHGVLSSRVLYFEREGAGFRPARAWSRRALATANTHDLVPLAGFAAGADLVLRRRAHAIPSQRALRERPRRTRRQRPGSRRPADRRAPAARPASRARRELAVAVSGFLSRTPCPLVALSLDDAVGESEPVNLPGVGPEGHPSWTRRMSTPLERLPAHPGWLACCAALRRARPGRRRAR